MGRGSAWAATVVAAVVWGCAPGRSFHAGDITVRGVVMPAPVVLESLATTEASAYFTMVNGGTVADTLRGVETPLAGSATLHHVVRDAGEVRMAMVEVVAVPGGASVRLRPGDWHVMMRGLARAPAAGDSVPLVLVFARAGRLPVTARVVRLDDLEKALVR